jgi:hypothetical protein
VDNGFLSYLQESRGWLFWTATAAMAAGLSLLLAVGACHVRRLIRRAGIPRRGRPRRLPLLRRNAVRGGPQEGYGDQAWRRVNRQAPDPPADGPVPRPTLQTPPGPQLAPEALAIMMRRLRSAADRLEEVAEGHAAAAAGGRDSDLKALGCDVEYVFRASSS